MEKRTVLCPFCNFDHVHIDSVKVNRGGEVTVIQQEGTRMQSSEPDGRGATIIITLWCENGHKWENIFHFHKGQTDVKNEILIAGDPTWGNFVHGLWRD